jgi:hypothetical protein
MIDVDLFITMIDLEGTYMLSKEDVIKELNEAVTSELLTNAVGSSEYSFVHD